jgi:hypothetical protein
LKTEQEILKLIFDLTAITNPYTEEEDRKALKEKIPKIFHSVTPEEYDILIIALAWVLGLAD